MNSMQLSDEYFIDFLQKCVRHLDILRTNYANFEAEYSKAQHFIATCDSQILRQKFRFLLKEDARTRSADSIDSDQLRLGLKSIRHLLRIIIHLSTLHQISSS